MLRCNSVLVKFVDKNLPQQEIHNNEATASVSLTVTRDGNFITIMHRNIAGLGLKQINFSIKDVKEYVCIGVNETLAIVPSGTLLIGSGPKRL